MAEAVTFAVPHATLGEDVAAAVVLWPACCGDAERHSPVRHRAHRRLQGAAPSAHRRGTPERSDRQSAAYRLGRATRSRYRAALPRASVAPRTCSRSASWHLGDKCCKSNGSASTMISSHWAAILLAIRVLTRLHESCRSRSRSPVFSRRPPSRIWLSISRRYPGGQAPRPSSAVVARSQRKWSSAGLHHPGTVVGAAARAARPAVFQYSLCAPADVGVDVAVLERSINEIVRRHEILRTTFAVVDGRYVQVIAPELTVPLTFDDLQALPHSEEGDGRHRSDSRRGASSFDLARGPLIAGSPGAPGRAGIPLAYRHAPGHRRWLVARRSRRGAHRFIRRLLGRRGSRPWGRSRSSLRTSRTGSGIGSRTRRSLRSSHTGESSFAIRCP